MSEFDDLLQSDFRANETFAPFLRGDIMRRLMKKISVDVQTTVTCNEFLDDDDPTVGSGRIGFAFEDSPAYKKFVDKVVTPRGNWAEHFTVTGSIAFSRACSDAFRESSDLHAKALVPISVYEIEPGDRCTVSITFLGGNITRSKHALLRSKLETITVARRGVAANPSYFKLHATRGQIDWVVGVILCIRRLEGIHVPIEMEREVMQWVEVSYSC